MPILERFDPPAFVDDFGAGEEQLREDFRAEWDRRVRCWFAVSQVGDAWAADLDSPRTRFFSPIGAELNDLIIPDEPVAWTAFPKRLNDFYANHPTNPLNREEILAIADGGPPLSDGWQPAGPRGWQDEYCEWTVDRNASGKITKVTFTCENPEYWETLWSIAPDKVRDLYRNLLQRNDIATEDLYLRIKGEPVVDRETGRPRYDRTNRFNRNQWEGGENGVIHLISRPNNLFAEIYLAGGATILRQKEGQPVTDRDVLIECSAYGQPGRNSDPNIGFYVNDLVLSNNIEVALANPVGLYIAGLNTQGFTLPDSAPDRVTASDLWEIKRGTADEILRAEFSVPDTMGFTVGDISIEGELIQRGSQLAERMQIKLSGYGRSPGASLSETLECKKRKVRTLPEIIGPLETSFEWLTASPSFKIRRGASQTVPLYCVDAQPNPSIELTGDGVSVQVLDEVSGDRAPLVRRIHATNDNGWELELPNGNRVSLSGNPAPLLGVIPDDTIEWYVESGSHGVVFGNRTQEDFERFFDVLSGSQPLLANPGGHDGWGTDGAGAGTVLLRAKARVEGVGERLGFFCSVDGPQMNGRLMFSNSLVLDVELSVETDAQLGFRDAALVYDGVTGPAKPCMFDVVQPPTDFAGVLADEAEAKPLRELLGKINLGYGIGALHDGPRRETVIIR